MEDNYSIKITGSLIIVVLWIDWAGFRKYKVILKGNAM
jgi:hypothetical protein